MKLTNTSNGPSEQQTATTKTTNEERKGKGKTTTTTTKKKKKKQNPNPKNCVLDKSKQISKKISSSKLTLLDNYV
jgi:hypothetical protein